MRSFAVAYRGLRTGSGITASWLAALAVVLSGCGSSSKAADTGPARPAGVLSDLKIFDTPPGGMAIYSDVIHAIPPGADVTYCTYTNIVTDKELFVHTTLSAQTTFGHHIITFYTETPEKVRTEECGGQDMTNFHQLLGGGNANGEGSGVWDPPPNVGTVIPKGAQFVVQTHWINTGVDAVDGQGMTVTVPGQDSPDRIAAGSIAIVNTTFQLPANSKTTTSTDCVFDTDHHVMAQLGHEHQWGSHVTAQVTHVGGAVETLFDRPFGPHDVFSPPVDSFGVVKPLFIAKGDTLRMTCEWQNTTDKMLGFPREMCVYFGYTTEPYDAHCVDGAWEAAASDAGAAPSGPPCVPVGAPGNEKQVGKYCSPKGGECAQNTDAVICAADYGGPDICTIPCVDQSACGSGAVCAGDSPTSTTKGCIPASCAPSWALDGGAASSSGDAAAP